MVRGMEGGGEGGLSCSCDGQLNFSTAGLEVKRACEYLLSHQMEDGGWGEDFAVSF